MTRALNQTEASFYRSMERVGGFGGKADQLNAYFKSAGTPDYFDKDLARYRARRPPPKCRPPVERYLPKDRRVRAQRRSGREEMKQDADPALCWSSRRRPCCRRSKPDRKQPPPIGPAPALKLPAIQKRKLSNGLAVWLVEHHEVPLAQVNLIVRSGSAADPIGKYGVGSLAAAMLDEGAGTRAALELADAIEFLGANLSTDELVRLRPPCACRCRCRSSPRRCR